MKNCEFYNFLLKKTKTRQQTLVLDAFYDLCSAKNRKEFTEKVNDWCKVLFSVSTAKFLFFEQNEFMEYDNTNIKNHKNNGVAGFAMSEKRPLIIYDIKKNHLFDPNVDLVSLLPILYYPIGLKKLLFYITNCCFFLIF